MLSVHLVARDNGAGLSRDLEILRRALGDAGFDLTISAIGAGGLRRQIRFASVRARLAWRGVTRGRAHARFDVNLMDERLRPKYAPLARRNVLLPHPEWFDERDRAWLPRLDRAFVLTHHAKPIFESLGLRADYTGFTSEDRRDVSVPRERAFFHLAGRSANKGTATLLATWRRHPEWPRLTVLQSPRSAGEIVRAANIEHRVDYIPDDELRRIQNAHRFHLCPSETEGFGHYLVEAMGIGAVVTTLDAPPMNEMITPARGALIPYSRTGTQSLATTYFYDGAALEAAIERLLETPDTELERMGAAARAWFEDNDRTFRIRIAESIRALV
jgi:hypothetical protein